MTAFDNINGVKGLFALLDNYSLIDYLENDRAAFDLPETQKWIMQDGYEITQAKLLDLVNKDEPGRQTTAANLGLNSNQPLTIADLHRILLPNQTKRNDLKSALNRTAQIAGLSSKTREALSDLLRLLDEVDNNNSFKQPGRLSKPAQEKFIKFGNKAAIQASFQSLTDNDRKLIARRFGLPVAQVSARTILDKILTNPADDSDLHAALCKLDKQECETLPAREKPLTLTAKPKTDSKAEKEARQVSAIIEKYQLLSAITYPDSTYVKETMGIPNDDLIRVMERFIARHSTLGSITFLKLALASAYIRRGEYEKALKLCEEMKSGPGKLSPNISGQNISLTFQAILRDKLKAYFPINLPELCQAIIGDDHWALGDKEGAIPFYQSAIDGLFPPGLSVKPTDINLVFAEARPALLKTIGDKFRGTIEGPFGEEEETIISRGADAYQLLMHDHPDYPLSGEIRIQLGEFLVSKNDPSKAIAAYASIAPTEKEYLDAQYEIGKIYLKQNKPNDAKPFLAKVALNKDSSSRRTVALQSLLDVFLITENIRGAQMLVEHMQHILPGSDDTSSAMFKLGLMLLFKDKNEAKNILTKISANPNSPYRQRAFELKQALEDPTFNPANDRAYKTRNFTLRTLKGFSIITFGNSLYPEIIPGKAKLFETASGAEIQIPRYHGKSFTATYKNPEDTLPKNNDALLQAFSVLPNELFEHFQEIVFTGREKKETAGDYTADRVNIYRSNDPFGTIIHEIAHHWDMSVAVGTDGKDLGPGDLSRLYYDISWTAPRLKKEKRSSDECLSSGHMADRADFERDEFASVYGLCNRREDLAEFVEAYVTKGAELRAESHKLMENGKFEKAVKYLFVRYIMPFRGREYPAENSPDSIDFEAVEKSLSAWQKAHPNSVSINTIEILRKIKERSRDNHYK